MTNMVPSCVDQIWYLRIKFTHPGEACEGRKKRVLTALRLSLRTGRRLARL
jgi:hypothetical protein